MRDKIICFFMRGMRNHFDIFLYFCQNKSHFMADNPVVSVCTLAFNHNPFIRECLDGILMQKTNFAFELIIHDDASTDGTADIIREYEAKYPNIITPIYQTENQYSKGTRIMHQFVYPKAKGKYIAICEGDDFWTDPYKLQKQVDILESNSEYGMCYTPANILHLDKSLTAEFLREQDPTINDLMIDNPVCTLTTIFRKELLLRYIEEVKSEAHAWRMGDYPLWIWFAIHSKIKYLPCITATYRYLEGSVSHSTNSMKKMLFSLNAIDIREYFRERYNATPPRKRYLKKIAHIYFENRATAIKAERWDIIKKELKVLIKLKYFGKYLKLALIYVFRNCNTIREYLIKRFCN